MATIRSGAETPGRPLRALAGLVSATVALSVGHLVAAVLNPAASPVVVVGSQLVDLAPTPVKEVVVRYLGTSDKPILIGAVTVVVLIAGALLGLIAWKRPRVAVVGVAALGLVGAVVALLRPGFGTTGVMPSLVASIVGVATLTMLVWLYRGDTTTPAPSDSPSHDVSRRHLMIGTAAGAALAALSVGGAVVIDRAKRAGAAAARRLGLPTPASPAPSIPAGAQVPGNTPFTTSIADFYRVDIALTTPTYSAEDWTLTLDGDVENPMTLTYDDLMAMPMIERDITLTCVSNEVGGSYVGTARWMGVPFSDLLPLLGVKPGVDQVFSYSMDSGYTCSTPFQAVSDGRDAMIVVGMNGEILPNKNGFPARMLVPGLFGFVSATKWLNRIEFTTYDKKQAYWTERDWATDAPILTAARIDVPASLSTLPKDKPVLAGVAWAQNRGIAKVEIRIDGGEWIEAKLADDAGIDLWRQWSHVFDGTAGSHTAEVRATDLNGDTQPEERRSVFPAGATGWHLIRFDSE
ncbi:MAG: molybdopterin-dependent oxidoreductase [Arachnia sp.]